MEKYEMEDYLILENEHKVLITIRGYIEIQRMLGRKYSYQMLYNALRLGKYSNGNTDPCGFWVEREYWNVFSKSTDDYCKGCIEKKKVIDGIKECLE